MMPRIKSRLAWLAGFGLAMPLAAFAVAGTAAAGGGAVYVSPSGSPSNSGMSCATAQYSTIGAGVAAAPAGGKVIVCQGTYAEMVSIDKALMLDSHGATINATGLDNGILITHSRVEVDGFTIRGANGEGILAQGHPVAGPIVNGQPTTTGIPISHLLIEHNDVRNNDQGGPQSSYTECQAQGQIPGDCGEGIHLWSVRDSSVVANHVAGNSGGILLTDEFGPTHGNLIANNVVEDNAFDCGITLASHNAGWNPGTQMTTPNFAGVYDNTIKGNLIRRNGLKGEGAGVLMAAAFPLAASYDNTVVGNSIHNNELAGVTIHSHPGGGYVSGNSVRNNKIGPNNKGGDPDAGVSETTGVLVYSTDQPTTVWVTGNLIYGNHYGVWYSGSTVTPTLSGNKFVNDMVNVKNG